ncbi:hypothetical protein Aph02nite_68440 [Actinoplanes philippinensis]|nr:hypothetical protein Aph02nite_68440 [Actinoplanes philippinensis]
MSHPLRRKPHGRDPEIGVAGSQDDGHSVYDQPDPESVHAQFDKLLDTTTGSLPKVAAYLDAARADLLAITGFPQPSGADPVE